MTAPSLPPGERSAMLKASDRARYVYSIKRFADFEEVWSLRNEAGWVLMVDFHGAQLIPLWPRQEFAMECVADDWKDCAAGAIGIQEFLERWISGAERDSRQFAVFPLPTGRGVVVTPRQLSEELSEELAKYE